MLSPKCKIEDYNVDELAFGDLIKFVELFQFGAPTSRIIQFKTYLDGLVSHKGLVQIKQNFSLKFENKSSYKYTVFSNILALLGPSAILPAHYTERAVALLKEDDKTMIDFVDIFYNKLMYSLYRILRGTDTVLNFQVYALRREEKPPYVVRQIASFIGIQEGITDLGLMLRYSGVVAMQHRSVSVLQSIISAFVNEAVFIDQFVLVKMPLLKEQQSQIGKKNCSLTQSLYCGSNVYLYQNKIRIKIKNLTLQSYKKLIAQKRDKNSALNKLISNYLGRGLSYDLELRIRESEKATRCCFSALGINVWCSNLN